MSNIFILGGSGISAESGVPMYRQSTGLWADHDIEAIATYAGFIKNPLKVLSFYDQRFAEIKAAQPNAAHAALAQLEADGQHHVTIVTQNIDDLHERAGSRNVMHIHGEITKALCSKCGKLAEYDMIGNLMDYRKCACGYYMRPDIVWFGEDVKRLAEIEAAFLQADIFLSIGTSGEVFPAAAYARRARNRKKRTVEFNTRRTSISKYFRESRLGPASSTVPAFVETLLQKSVIDLGTISA